MKIIYPNDITQTAQVLLIWGVEFVFVLFVMHLADGLLATTKQTTKTVGCSSLRGT